MTARDFYATLGVRPDATPDDIRRAYRHLAMHWHPDRNKRPDAAARFREIHAAYECLKDPACRATYDAQRASRQRNAWSEQQTHPDPPQRDDALDQFLREADASLRITPEMLVTFFVRIEALLRRAFA